MNVHTIEVTAEEARRKLDAYKALRENQRTTEDRLLEKTYKAIERGARVIDITAAFRETGLNEKGEPRLAIARADGAYCYFYPEAKWESPNMRPSGYRPGFSIKGPFWDDYSTRSNVLLPQGIFGDKLQTGRKLRTPVPHIPPAQRPRYKFENYHILFEVAAWEAYPVDPYLLKRISGSLFIVLAEWELTELEASLLGGLKKGS